MSANPRYKHDPEYLAAQRAYVADYPSASEAFRARNAATETMDRVENAYAADPDLGRLSEIDEWAREIADTLPPFTPKQITEIALLAAKIEKRIAAQ